MELNKVIHGDCLEVLKTIPRNSVDSIVTDPPYHLVSIVKRFGGENSRNTPAMNTKEGGVFARKAKGFMGKEWDGVDENGMGIAMNVDMWAECLRVLKPGGHLLAFSGTRTYHRMAVAIEDAGFEVRDMIEWVYGSGFPKSLNIGKAVDKLRGNEREELGEHIQNKTNPDSKNRSWQSEEGVGNRWKLSKGTSEWEGWGTALKPAHEPICMARKPLAEKTVAENVLKYGTGGINIDESRVGTEVRENPQYGNGGDLLAISKGGEQKWDGTKETVSGRFPANLILGCNCLHELENRILQISNYIKKNEGSFEIGIDEWNRILDWKKSLEDKRKTNFHFNDCEVRECFPESKSPAKRQTNSWYPTGESNGIDGEADGYGDQGNASRFFKSIIYQAKASKSERNKGCEGLEEKVQKSMGDFKENPGRTAPKSGATPTTNHHPTVKPLKLMEYLIKMVTPKGGIVLDPFAGSGSTLVAAKQNGFNYIGIELTEEYIPIIEARLKKLPSTLF